MKILIAGGAGFIGYFIGHSKGKKESKNKYLLMFDIFSLALLRIFLKEDFHL